MFIGLSVSTQSKYCPPPRPVDRFGLPNLWSMVVEAHEAASSLLTPLMVKFLVQHSSRLVSIHVSDQYTGLKDDSRYYIGTVYYKLHVCVFLVMTVILL